MAAVDRKAEAKKKAAAAAKGTGTSNSGPVRVQSKELVKANKETSVEVASKMASMLEGDAGAGSENLDRQDLAIPRISIIQSNSPQLKKAEGKYIKGAEEGDFLDTVTNEVFAKGDVGFLFIIASYRRTDIEWIPRTKGGGFVADHGSDSDILTKASKDADTGAMLLKNGNEVVTTAEYIGLAMAADGEMPRQVAISLAKTQLKKARRLNTILTTLSIKRASGTGNFNPAFFYSFFKATSIPEQSKKGESYMGWQFTREGNTLDLQDGEELYISARQFREAITAGDVKVAAPQDADPGAGADDDSTL